MRRTSILDGIAEKEYRPEVMIEEASKSPEVLADIFEGISSRNKRVKNRCARVLQLASRKYPEKLYSRMDLFIDLLDGEDTILKWVALDVIANLTPVDSKNRFDEILERYYGYLSDESMITAAHVVDNSATIARSKAHFRAGIIDKLLGVEEAPYSEECRNILAGKVIVALESIFDLVEDKEKVLLFVASQRNNSRNATKAKAERFLRKHGS
jgi:hypothetical protein